MRILHPIKKGPLWSYLALLTNQMEITVFSYNHISTLEPLNKNLRYLNDFYSHGKMFSKIQYGHQFWNVSDAYPVKVEWSSGLVTWMYYSHIYIWVRQHQMVSSTPSHRQPKCGISALQFFFSIFQNHFLKKISVNF